jgi:RNA polymerase sigma-70 factor (ECF subfamily)
MTTITAEGLTGRLADDVKAAFPDLVRALQDGIYSGALQFTRNAHDAEEVTQETFARVFRALDRYDPERIRSLDLHPWVWTIALNICRNRARSRARRPEVPTTGLDLQETAYQETTKDPGTLAAATADLETWRGRLSRLSEPQRTAVVLHHVVGMSHLEIAEVTGRTESTTRSDLRRGLAALRRNMEEESS